jgi:single-stranded-DNA-specific exonuclease
MVPPTTPSPAIGAVSQREAAREVSGRVPHTDLGRGLVGRWVPRFRSAARPAPESSDPHEPLEPVGERSLLERLLVARGVAVDGRDRFLRPSLTELERPWERPDLMAVADALLEATLAGRSIAIYGDYDVDGITATAVLWHALRAIRPDAPIRTYVPHRMDEGYGLNADAIRTLAEEGVSCIVTVDCGVTAVAEAAIARELGVELLITDHHRPREDGELPSARAIAHPALPGREHRFTDCCGSAVAWKLAWAIFDRHAGSAQAHRLPEVLRTRLTSLLPLAAIGTIADVMPLVGENRAIVWHGIGGIAKTGIAGLDALLKLGDVGDAVEAETIGFRLAPRLNAVGRLGSAEAAVRLLTTATAEEARGIVRDLDVLNAERKETERAIFESACRRVEECGMDRPECPAIVLASPTWHAGVVGIVCSRLVERFARPTILLQELDDLCKGSGRSVRGFSLVEAIQGCGELPLKSGGHDIAAGLTLSRERFEAFREAFTRYAIERIDPEHLVRTVEIDAVADISEIDVRSIGEIAAMAPFGRGNPRPALLIRGATLVGPPKAMGKEKQHLLLRFTNKQGRWIKAKWWDGRRHASHLLPDHRYDLVVTVGIDRYLGAEEAEAEIRDLRACDR